MKLIDCNELETVKVLDLGIDDEEFKTFLFSLGCYSGEDITVISKKRNGVVIAVKDGRYNIDTEVARLITVEA